MKNINEMNRNELETARRELTAKIAGLKLDGSYYYHHDRVKYNEICKQIVELVAIRKEIKNRLGVPNVPYIIRHF